ncbi:MAG: MFS transporter [Gammaproteobacteria bacterium]|nr:MFS transporter [Gammaproteobacteria bacterium]
MAAGKFSALRSAFSNRNYAIYMCGNSISLIGFWMQRLAVAWLAWILTESEFWVGAVAFVEIAPLIFVTPLFGVWADRLDRKTMAVIAQLLMMLQAFILFYLVWLDLLTIGLLFSLALVEGVIQAAYQPVRLSIIPNLIKKEDLVAASAFTAVAFNVARFIGPALAGGVMLVFGPAIAILFNAVSYLLILVAWFFIDLPERIIGSESKSFFRDIRDGYHYVVEKPGLLAMFVLLTVVSFFARPVAFMLSAFVGGVYEAGEGTLALFTSAMGVGAVLAGLRISMDGQTRGLVREILWMTLVAILTLIGFASIKTVWIATGLILVFGYAITIGSVAGQTLVQNSIDDHMRGRVLSLWAAFTRGAPAVGVLIIGWFANIYGLMLPNIVAALCCFIGLILMIGKRQQMREFFES